MRGKYSPKNTTMARNLLNRANVSSTNSNKQNLPKLFCLDTNRTPGVLSENVHGALQRHGINLEVIARNLLKPLDLALHGRMIPMIVLGTEPETRHCTIMPQFGEVLIADQVANRELVSFDPELS